MLTNPQLKQQARLALSGKWGISAVLVLIFYAISSISAIPIIGSILALLLIVPLGYCLEIIFLGVARGNDVCLDTIVNTFKTDYMRVLGTMLLRCIYTLLWTLLLIVPGIIKACSYAMTSYVLHDEPTLAFDQAIERSMAMMDGYKMKYFILLLSFIGWAILAILTLGIGFLWLIPYVQTSAAKFYDDLKANQQPVI